MKHIKRFFISIIISTMFISAFSLETSASVRKGTVRVVIKNQEISKSSDELVYNNKRYISVIYYVLPILTGISAKLQKTVYNLDKGSLTFELSPKGYISFWGGSKSINIAGTKIELQNPALLYENLMYISVEDIAKLYSCNYGFDASKNTIYIF